MSDIFDLSLQYLSKIRKRLVLIISAFAGLFSLLALVRQGSNVFHLRLTELTITGRPSVGARNEKQV